MDIAHAFVIGGLLLLALCLGAWLDAQRRFRRLLAEHHPELARELGAGERIRFCQQGRHRQFAAAELRAAGERLLRSHRLLVPAMMLLVCLVTLLIVFSSDPGNVDDTLWVY